MEAGALAQTKAKAPDPAAVMVFFPATHMYARASSFNNILMKH